ncbi:MAG: MFS transporter [Clostridiales Family XIII bacterium]|jgi:MFS family permease|nr:MFS transporter [Clostridiales Family XIII bacterium]
MSDHNTDRRPPSLIKTLTGLRGNPRACIYTEPMWGLSMNLCLPYASVYMLAIGLNDVKVGIIASIYMCSQMIFSLLSGIINDKYGRRFSTALFDFLSWSVPCLIWAFAQGFWFFAVAAMLNGMMKITEVSWDCLLVEDAERSQITRIYTWVIICGNLSAVFAPIAAILVSKFSLVPAVRILYINAFIIMTAKIVILYLCSKETQIGVKRMAETKNKSWLELLSGYKHVLSQMLQSKGILFAIFISMIVSISIMINSTFWQIIASKYIGVPDTLLPIFPMVRSVISIVFLFGIIGKMNQKRLKHPLIIGFVSYLISCLLLILTPGTTVFGYICLGASILTEAFGVGTLSTLRESLVAIHAQPAERSRILAVLHTTVMLISIPFGYISGLLSEVSRILPFVLIMCLIVVGIVATALSKQLSDEAVV